MIVDADRAVTLLNNGDVAAIPTETVYGLAGSIRDEKAMKKIFEVKKRPFFDPLIVHVADTEQIKDVASSASPAAQKLMEKFWPGPLTLVLPKTSQLPSLITSDLPNVAVRMPKHPIALDIIRRTGPLAAPSANRFGKTSPTRAQHVDDEFRGKVAVVDGGDCDVGIESTVIKVNESENEIEILILRPGVIGEEELNSALSDSQKIITVEQGAAKDSPGQLENHYQPEKPLVIADEAVLWTDEVHQDICRHLECSGSGRPVRWSFSEKTPALVARTLYAEMREKTAEGANAPYLYLALPKNYYKPSWSALRDRIEKASYLKIKLIDEKPMIFIKSSAK